MTKKQYRFLVLSLIMTKRALFSEKPLAYSNAADLAENEDICMSSTIVSGRLGAARTEGSVEQVSHKVLLARCIENQSVFCQSADQRGPYSSMVRRFYTLRILLGVAFATKINAVEISDCPLVGVSH